MRERVATECGCATTGTISRGLCGRHYAQYLRTTPKAERVPSPRDAKRFDDFVDKSGDCWLWTGTIKRKGYGWWSGGGQRGLAHRIALAAVTPPPALGLLACHKCDNPPCVRPDHLYWGTAKDNSRDVMERSRVVNANVYKTHCKNGHEFAGDNLAIVLASDGPRRRCRTCLQARSRQRAAAKRAQRAA